MKLLKIILAALMALLIAGPAFSAQVMVFAAASLTDTLKRIGADYQKSSSDEVVFNFAGSGTLARQIEAGAPADVFISADEAKADLLEQQHLLVPGTRVPLVGNTLVFITAPENVTVRVPADLTHATVGRVALGDVKTVPAGAYARAYLEKIGLWNSVNSKVVPCESVRAVLGAVESGNVDAGIVYKTDAAVSKKVKVAYAVPGDDGPRISYPLALLKDAPQPEAAKKFIAYLKTENATKVFREFGFAVLDASAGK